MPLIKELLERPANLPLTSKYTVIGGVLYLGGGALLVVWPGATQTIFRDPAFVGHEQGLVRAMAMSVMVIGWLYLWGGRSGRRPFTAATVPDRVILVPAVLVPLALSGVFPHLLLAIVVLDVALGIGAWVLLGRTGKAGAAA